MIFGAFLTGIAVGYLLNAFAREHVSRAVSWAYDRAWDVTFRAGRAIRKFNRKPDHEDEP